MIYLPSEGRCTGCSACFDVCPKQAISMKYDTTGFLYPTINNDSCIECHLCEKKCPALSDKDISNPYLESFAGFTTDELLLLKTASGGFATALSKLYIQNGGLVAGVKLASDISKSEYNLASTEEEIQEFSCSKYVQSEKKSIYLKVLSALKENKQVLFIGCPCDVAGLKSVLGNKPQDNLLTCELVCMGVTSPKISEQFLDYAHKKYKSKIIYYNARSKKNGWFVSTLEMKLESGKTKYQPLYGSYFGQGFLIYNRPSCFSCKYRGVNGIADIRIGDFWGIKNTDKYWNKNGVSCIFVRTQKGIEAIRKMKENNFSLFPVNYSVATNNNMSSIKNKNYESELKFQKFRKILLAHGLIAACKQTSSLSFLMKKFIPTSFQPFIKRTYHFFRDK